MIVYSLVLAAADMFLSDFMAVKKVMQEVIILFFSCQALKKVCFGFRSG